MTEPVPTGEARETRLKRLHMRSMRRGIKEMDIILSRFSESLSDLSDSDLDAYDQVLAQNDQDLYQWVSGQEAPPAALAPMITRIAQYP